MLRVDNFRAGRIYLSTCAPSLLHIAIQALGFRASCTRVLVFLLYGDLSLTHLLKAHEGASLSPNFHPFDGKHRMSSLSEPQPHVLTGEGAIEFG